MSKPLSRLYSQSFAAIEVGHFKITCWIIKLDESGHVKVLGHSHQATKGYVNGQITNLDALSKRLARVVEEAESLSKERIRYAMLTLGGTHLQNKCFKSQVALLGSYVSEEDIKRLHQDIRLQVDARKNHILHILPQSYTLDHQPHIQNPKGMMGKNLQGLFHVIFIPTHLVRNLLIAIENIHLELIELSASAYTTSLANLSEDERHLGALLLDIGAGGVTLTGFKDDRLAFIDYLAMGGQHITKDLAYGLDVDLKSAERIKILQGGCLRKNLARTSDTLDYMVGNQNLALQASFADERLIDVIAPRVEEIVRMLQAKIEEQKRKGFFYQKTVLIGGSSQLQGLPEMLSDALGKPVRLSKPKAFQDFPFQDPSFASISSLIYSLSIRKPQEISQLFSSTRRSQLFFNQIISWFRENL